MSATDQAAADDAMTRGEATVEEQAETTAARTALALADPADATLPARHQWDRSQVAVIRQTVAKDCNDAELSMFLEVSARYKLDPFLREIFAAKFNGDQGPVTIFAGRDGLLKAAKGAGKKLRHMESQVVREKDEYEVVIDTDSIVVDEDTGMVLHKLRKLRHVQKGMGTAQRGPIVGAYAMVWMEGDSEPWFAQATWEDYGSQKSGWGKSTWKTDGSGYPEAMMIKVPQSIALRMAAGLAGIYAQEEVQKQIDAQQERRQDTSKGDGEGHAAGVDWPESELELTLQALVDRANELVPGSWRAPKVAVNVNGKSGEQLEALAKQLRRFVRERSPEDPLAVEPEEVTDADVVEDGGTDPESADPATDAGPMPQELVDRMQEPEVRAFAMARYEELRVASLSGQFPEGFDTLDDVVVELDRLEAALNESGPDAGQPTVAEELEREPEPVDAEVVEPDAAGETGPPVEGWGDAEQAEYEVLEHAIADLEAALEDAEEGTEGHRVTIANLADARARWTQLRKAKAKAEREARHAEGEE